METQRCTGYTRSSKLIYIYLCGYSAKPDSVLSMYMYKLKYKYYRSEGEGRTEDAIAMRQCIIHQDVIWRMAVLAVIGA